MQFQGYKRENGQYGVRKHILVLSSVVCANHVVNQIAENVKIAVPFCHANGCGQLGIDREQTLHTLIGVGKNPNVAAVLIVSLGCESLPTDVLFEEIKSTGKRLEYINIQDEGGSVRTVGKGIKIASSWSEDIQKEKRVPVRISELTIGLECGGSDATSGLFANPVLGYVSDSIVDNGGTSILSETPEFIGAEHILAKKTFSKKIAQEIYKIVNNFEKKAMEMKVDIRITQPSPGNQKGGITTIEEKSLGCIAKAGRSLINEVVTYAGPPKKKGLIVMDTTGFDVESVTGMISGGAQIVLFTTGRGTPVGSPIAPVIKITGNNETFMNMEDNIDFNVGQIIHERKSIEEMGNILLKELLSVASGKITKAEKLGHHEVGITRIGPSI
jgi:altronate dehydratase large subunit